MSARYSYHSDYDSSVEEIVGRREIEASNTNAITTTSHLEVVLRKRQMANAPDNFANFHTPDNKVFYAKLPYLKLDPDRNEIRLLRILSHDTYEEIVKKYPHFKAVGYRSNWSDFSRKWIVSQLIDKVSLSSINGAYCTLSYCAGSPKNVGVLVVDGLPFHAFSNLEHAIACLYDLWKRKNPDQDLLLWVDQVCINQDDCEERAHQVAMMRDIYRRSNTTFVCLSSPGPPGSVITDSLSWIPQSSLEGDASARVSDFESYAERQIIHECKSENILLGDLKFGDLKPGDLKPGDLKSRDDSSRCWTESLLSFLSQPWWTRAWVYQEFVVSPSVELFTHESILNWNDISPLLQYVFDDFPELLSRLLEESNGAVKEYHPQEEEYERHRNAEWNKKLNIQEKEYSAHYLQSLQRLGRLRDNKKAVLSRTNPFKFIDRRRLRHQIKVVDEKLAMWQSNIPATSVDLHKQYGVSRVYPLKHCVQDEQLRETTGMLLMSFPIHPDVYFFKSSLQAPMRPSACAVTKQHIDNFQTKLDRTESSLVRSIMSQKLSGQRSLDLKVHLSHSRMCKSSDPRDRIYAFIGLARKEYSIVPNYSSNNTVIHELINTAKRIIFFEKSLDILAYAWNGRRDLGCHLPSWVPDWTCKHFDADPNQFQFAFCAKHKMVDAKPGIEHFSASAGREMYATFEESMGNQADVKLKVTGILISVLQGPSNPVKDCDLVHSFSCPERKDFLVVPKSALEDDEVWVLHGASKPVALRPEGENRYGFLGEVWMVSETGRYSSVMYGDLKNLPGENSAGPASIYLV